MAAKCKDASAAQPEGVPSRPHRGNTRFPSRTRPKENHHAHRSHHRARARDRHPDPRPDPRTDLRRDPRTRQRSVHQEHGPRRQAVHVRPVLVRRRRAAAAPGLRGIEDGPQRRRRVQGHRPHHQAEDQGRRAGPDHLLLRRQVHRPDPAHEPGRPARAHRHQRRRDEHQHPLPRHAGGLRRLRRQRVHDHPDRPPVHVPLPHPGIPPPRHLLVPRPQPHHHPAPGDAGHRGHHHHRGRARSLAGAQGNHRAQLRAPRLPEGPHRRGGPGHPGLVAHVPPGERPEVPRHRHPPRRDQAPALLRAGTEHLLLPGFRR